MFLMLNNGRSVQDYNGALDNFIRSTAGYSVITYFLGVGDRHLDNILLTRDGCLFHVDYGFILGKDPKPLPPLVRLTKEMIEGFGGSESAGYSTFLEHCVAAFRILRRFAPLLIAVFSLICDSGLPGIDSSREAQGFLHQRLRLDLDDDQSSDYIRRMMNETATLLAPQLMEKIHTAVQKKRK